MIEYIEDCQAMTERIGIPGLTVTRLPIPEESDTILCQYDPGEDNNLEYPSCTRPFCRGFGKPGNFTKTQHIIYDILDDDPENVIKLDVSHREYTCSICRQKIPMDSCAGELPKGRMSTRRLDTWITKQCLDNSPAVVSEMVGQKIKESTIRDIFVRTTNDPIANYSRNVLAPKMVGVQLHSVGKIDLVIVADLDNRCVLDVFQDGDGNGLNKYLLRLARSRRTKQCVCDINTNCLIAVKGTIGSQVGASTDQFKLQASSDTTIIASHRSVYREISKAYTAFIEQYYTGPHKTDVKQFFALPLDYKVLTREKMYIQNCFNRCQHSRIPALRDALESFAFIRRVMRDNLVMKDFDSWTADVSSSPYFDDVLDLIDCAHAEISRSVLRCDWQKPYNSVADEVADLLEDRCKKCSFDIMRRRVLLSCAPIMTPVSIGGVVKYMYSGISIDDLKRNLRPYNS